MEKTISEPIEQKVNSSRQWETMVPERLELSAFALLVRRSDQLSYGTTDDSEYWGNWMNNHLC